MTQPLPQGPLLGAEHSADDFPATLTDAARAELEQLWGDLAAHRRYAHNGVWSVGCENKAYRIVALSRLVGALPWGQVDVDVLLDGLYERLHTEAGIAYPAIDWERVRAVKAANVGSPA